MLAIRRYGVGTIVGALIVVVFAACCCAGAPLPDGSRRLIPTYARYTAPPPFDAPRGTGDFIWPTTGYLTQSYWPGHQAVDVGVPTGTPIHVADAGYVTVSGWAGGYGNCVVVNHLNGFETLYAHMNDLRAVAGQRVQPGDLIGLAGSTGNSVGPHLHFEIRQGGVKRNPLDYLPRG